MTNFISWICWKLKWGWVLCMQHVGDGFVVEYWENVKTKETRTCTIITRYEMD